MDGCSIRQAVHADTPKLYAIDRIARHDEDRRAFVDRAIREARCWVVERRNVVAGFGIISHEFFGRSFLDLIYIDEQNRGQGLGPKLIRALEQESKSRSLFTSTNQSNLHMRHVLEGLGYEPSGIIHNLDPGDPEVVYVKRSVRSD
jgi:ribosomal protein S18 acetylase RimI-like enzyme